MRRRLIAYAVALLICFILLKYATIESYKPIRSDYGYNVIDTNPMRRVSDAFDNCSPDDMESCKFSNPYEGLPLP